MRSVHVCRRVQKTIIRSTLITNTRHFSASVNKNEVDKFSVVGGNWWSRMSAAGTGPLHDMNPPRIDFIRENIAAIRNVGCGGGLLSESLSRLGAVVTGIDPSAENIQIATNHSRMDPLTATIRYKMATIESVAESGEKFDAVCSLEVIEHVEDPRSFVAACCACLEPGGSLILSTMNRTQKAYLMTIVGAEYVLGIVPAGTHDWNKYITPNEMRSIIHEAVVAHVENDHGSGKCEVLKISGLVMRPPSPLTLINSFASGGRRTISSALLRDWVLSDTDTDVNYIVHAVKK